ncbi:MAG: cysteine--tRNA ligase [Patescibacteria group bacterium]
MKLYNSKTRKKETFKPLGEQVKLYTCGPTVYDYAHIGNLRTYIFEDVLKRTLKYNEYSVKHVMNITDVGHLVSDDDSGEDKVEKKAKEESKDAWELTEYYTKQFKADIKDLSIESPDVFVKATNTIQDQINLIKTLEEKGFTYKIKDGVYFDTSKLDDYGKMANLDEREAGKRVEMKGKKNATDFALWKFSRPDENRQMEWGSPWGVGFPGWHTECVVMSQKHLGVPFDIHCGGIDHVEIHHPNEIAQSKAAYGKNPANYWMHGEFLTVKEEKMSKSKGNFYTLKDISKNFDPLAYRYLCLNSHYRSKMNFSTEAMQGAQNSLKKLRRRVQDLPAGSKEISNKYKKKFLKAINDDLNTPKGLKVTWNLIKDKNIKESVKKSTILDFDNVLGLNLNQRKNIPDKVKELAEKRKKFRKENEYEKADEMRDKINDLGFEIEDIKDGYKLKQK